jgi:pyroglutamyl-peptidase
MSAKLADRAAPCAPRAARTSVLMTGFGPFPGVGRNATLELVPELALRAERLFAGVEMCTAILPTEWTAAPRRIAALIAEGDPDLVLHFGVSQRARGFEIEMRARNAAAASPDAAGALPEAPAIHPEGRAFLPTSLPVHHLAWRLRRIGVPAYVSRDAGAYLCNWLLYHSLARAPRPGRRIGFIHVPTSLARAAAQQRARPLSWQQAIAGGLEILAACLGRPPAEALGRRAHLAWPGWAARGYAGSDDRYVAWARLDATFKSLRRARSDP